MNENKLLFLCTRKDFQTEHQKLLSEICIQSNINWELVDLIAVQHSVAPLVYLNLKKCFHLLPGIPANALIELKSICIENFANKKKQEQNIVTSISKFQQKSVNLMLVKGIALNYTVYESCFWYVIGDIDLILNNKVEDISQTEDLEDIQFFDSLNINEWERFEHHDVNINGLLPINFQQIWQRAIEINISEKKAFIMCPEDMLLTACINSCRKRYFRLKSLLDIAEIINYYPDFNWMKFLEICQEFRCDKIIYTSLYVTSITVGCNLPNNFLDSFNINLLTKFLIKKLSQYMINNISLSYLLPSLDKNLLSKDLDYSLLLTIISYDWFQSFARVKRMFEK